MARLNKEREKDLRPKRKEFAKTQIEGLGLEIIHENETSLQFYYKGENVILYPYSGWFSGKTVKDGRGIQNLIKQLK